MARIGERGDLVKCSFCGRSQRQVNKVIAGPGVYICDECVDLCYEMLEEELLLDPRTRVSVESLEQLLEDWVDNFDPQDVQDIERAKLVFDRMLQRLAQKTAPAESP